LASAFVGAPTRMIAALPDRRAMRSAKKSSSVPIVALLNSARSCESRVSSTERSPRPPMIVVLSLVTRTCVARPRCSVVICSSANAELLLCTLPPHSAAMSSSRWIRFSPNPGALIATAWNVRFTWLCTSICSAVPSTVSATITNGRRSARMTLSRTGMIDCTSLIFSAEKRMYGSSTTASRVPGFVTMYGVT